MAAPLSMASVMSDMRRWCFDSWLSVVPLQEKKSDADGVRSGASFEMDVLFTNELLLGPELAAPPPLLQ